MSNGSISFLGTVLGLIPFLLAIIIFSLYLFVRSWRNNVSQSLGWIREELRQLQAENVRIRKQSEAFNIEDPEPFDQLAQNLSDQLIQIDQLIKSHYDRYSDLHARANRLNHLEWRTVIRLPWDWKTLNTEVEDFMGEIDILRGLLEDSSKLGHKLFELGKETAQKSQAMIGLVHDTSAILKRIQDSGTQGDLLETAFTDVSHWENTLLAQIPVVFFTPPEENVAFEPDKEAISRVHRVLSAASQPVEKIHDRALEWEKMVAGFRQDVDGIQKQNTVLVGLMDELEKRTANPLIWEKTRSQFDSINLRLERVGQVEMRRTLEQIQAEAGTIQSIQSRQRELAEQCQKAKEAYSEVLGLWASPYIQQGSEWVKKSRAVMAEVKTYDPENWPKEVHVQQYAHDLAELGDLQERVVPHSAGVQVKESELTRLLEAVRRLMDLHTDLRSRLESIQARLKDIQTQEKDTRDELVKVRALLSQVIPLIGANSLLSKTAGSESDKLRASVDQMIQEIDQTANGTVQKKVQKANSQIQRIQQSANKWFVKLSEELTSNLKDLGESLSLLKEVSTLDDPGLVEAEKLVLETGTSSLQDQSAKSGSLSLQDAVVGLRQKNEAWQRSIACIKNLEEIAGPVLDRYKKADKNRQAALDKYSKADRVVPENVAWPPTMQSMTQERQQFQSLERQWATLRQGKMTSLQLVSRLSDLSEQYHGLAIEFDQITDKAEQEQVRVKDYDRRLEESKKLWQQQINAHPDNRSLKDNIQNLLADIEKEYEALKTRYGRGGLPYNQALQNLRLIIRKIDDAQIPYGDNQIIDINGMVQKRIY